MFQPWCCFCVLVAAYQDSGCIAADNMWEHFAEHCRTGCSGWSSPLSTLTSTWKKERRGRRRCSYSLYSFCSPSLQVPCSTGWLLGNGIAATPPPSSLSPCFSCISGVPRALWASVWAKCQHSACPLPPSFIFLRVYERERVGGFLWMPSLSMMGVACCCVLVLHPQCLCNWRVSKRMLLFTVSP